MKIIKNIILKILAQSYLNITTINIIVCHNNYYFNNFMWVEAGKSNYLLVLISFYYC